MYRQVFCALLCLVVGSASAHAQAVVDGGLPGERVEVPPQHVTVHDIANRSLHGPRAEVISGAVVTGSAPLMGLMIAMLAGPALFSCGLFTDPDPACEARREREEDRARRLALGIAVPWGVVGMGLIAHGAYRLREIRIARRSLAFSPTYDLSRRTVGLQLAF